jgi:hypothetical protein
MKILVATDGSKRRGAQQMGKSGRVLDRTQRVATAKQPVVVVK